MCKAIYFQYSDIVLESEVKDLFEIVSVCPVCSLGNRVFVEVDPNPALEFPAYEYDHVVYQRCANCRCLLSFKIHI